MRELNQYQRESITAQLFTAARKGRVKKFQALLDVVGEVDIYGRNASGYTMLDLATLNGHVEIVDILLQRSAQTETPIIALEKAHPENGCTALHFAAMRNRPSVVQKLLQYQENVDVVNVEHDTPLHIAATYNHIQIARILLKRGANPQLKNKIGDTSLSLAVERDFTEMLSILSESFIPTDLRKRIKYAIEKGYTALEFASFFGLGDIAHLLLIQNKCVDSKTYQEDTPLHLAADNGFIDVVSALLEKNASVHAVNAHCETPLHRASYHGHTEIVRLLLERGASPSVQNEEGHTPLHFAAHFGHADILHLLLGKGGAGITHIKTNRGHTALALATFESRVEIIGILFPASRPSKEDMQNLIYTSLRNDDHASLAYFLKKGAKLDENISLYFLLDGQSIDQEQRNKFEVLGKPLSLETLLVAKAHNPDLVAHPVFLQHLALKEALQKIGVFARTFTGPLEEGIAQKSHSEERNITDLISLYSTDRSDLGSFSLVDGLSFFSPIKGVNPAITEASPSMVSPS